MSEPGSHGQNSDGSSRWGVLASSRRFASSVLRGGGRVNFRPAGGVRRQVAGCTSQEATSAQGPGRLREVMRMHTFVVGPRD